MKRNGILQSIECEEWYSSINGLESDKKGVGVFFPYYFVLCRER